MKVVKQVWEGNNEYIWSVLDSYCRALMEYTHFPERAQGLRIDDNQVIDLNSGIKVTIEVIADE